MSAPEAALLSRPILIIEDTELNLQLMLNILDKRGFTNVVSARDGVEALEKITITKPDLILLDVMMPRMDGAVFCKYLRTMLAYSRIPILVLAATPQEYMKLAVLGATDMVQKPIIPRLLISKVLEHLTLAAIGEHSLAASS